ncbi:MAG TPA: phosphofructokinase [Mucilaginibacter sp.]|jgi:6-phosphofructokinase 2|nr:phosphofructokinase [Mucilaginibacter sp.]
MPEIITVTFNPAIDKSISIAELIPDKKLKCMQPVYEPGGGGVNVARAIKKLGYDAVAIYLAGGDTGRKITRLLKNDQIESIVIETTESTRENLIVADIANSKQYLFDMPGPEINMQEWQQCLDTIEHLPGVKFIVASGSLPKGVPSDIFARIAMIARKKNAKLIVDTTGEALKQAVQAGVYLIKPNLKELAALTGKDELGIEAVANVAREIINMGKVEAIVVSMGPNGAMLVTRDLVQQIVPPHVEIETTVGAGDSMVAGIVMSLAENKNLTEAVQYGVACGTAATMKPGTELCTREDAALLYKIIRNQPLV